MYVRLNNVLIFKQQKRAFHLKTSDAARRICMTKRKGNDLFIYIIFKIVIIVFIVKCSHNISRILLDVMSVRDHCTLHTDKVVSYYSLLRVLTSSKKKA